MFIEKAVNGISISMRRKVFGVGVNDANYIVQPRVNGKQVICPFYRKWQQMLTRCYSLRYHKRFPSYLGCKVCDEWLIFSAFKRWMEIQDWHNKELDKDITFTGNKLYSPAMCMFVTHSINSLLIDCSSSRGELPVGVCKIKRTGRFKASCSINSKQNHIGYFGTQEEASRAYNSFKSNVILLISRKQKEPLRTHLHRISNEYMAR